MSRTLTVSDSIVIPGVAPSTVYDQVSDPTKMGRWSPENTGAVVAAPRGGAYVGMEFDGKNKRGNFSWTTRCRVSVADPGSAFEFRVRAIGLSEPRLRAPIATWQYLFEEVPEGTRVTETWTDDRTRWPDVVANVFDKLVTRGDTFAHFQGRNIRKTLENLQTDLG